MKRIVIGALLLLAFFAEPILVYAQQSDRDAARDAKEQAAEKKKEEDNPLLREYHERQKQNAAIEKQYERTLRDTERNVAPAHVDPWANMRGTDTSNR